MLFLLAQVRITSDTWALAPASTINIPVCRSDPKWLLDDEWAEVRSILVGPPPQCTHPAIMRRWQMLVDLSHPDALEFMYPSARWVRADTQAEREREG